MMRKDTSLIPDLVRALLDGDGTPTWTSVIGQLGLSRAPASFAKSKQRCVDLLYRGLAWVDVEQLHPAPLVRGRIRALRQLNAAQILLSQKSRISVVDVLTSSRDAAVKYQLHVPLLIMDRIRRRELAFMNRLDEYEECNKRMIELERVIAVELQAERAEDEMRELVNHYHRQLRTSRRRIDKLRKDVTNYLQQSDTYVTRLAYYRVMIWSAHLAHEYHIAAAAGTEAVAWMQSLPDFRNKDIEDNFLGNVLTALLQIAPDEDTLKAWDQILQGQAPSSPDAHSVLQAYAAALFTHRRYQQVSDLILQCLDNCPKDVPDWRRLTWILFALYAAELAAVGMVQDNAALQELRVHGKSRIQAFERVYSKHKPTTSALLFIIDIIRLLRERKFSAVIDLTDQLQKYVSRYELEAATARTARFMRMLSTLIAADFDPDKAEARAAKILAKYPDADTWVRDESEIVPFDELWNVVIYHLRDAAGERR
jgi:hypothetical protein